MLFERDVGGRLCKFVVKGDIGVKVFRVGVLEKFMDIDYSIFYIVGFWVFIVGL